MAKAKQRTYRDVKEMIEKENYVLLSKEEDIVNEKGFVLARTYLLVWCKNPKHEPRKITLNSFHQGKRCKLCRDEALKKDRAFSYDFVKEYFNNEGYELLSKTYTNSNEKLSVICPQGHNWSVSFTTFKHGGHRCPYCYNKKLSEKMTFSYEYVKEYIESIGYKLLSKEYKGNQEKLILACPKGHVREMTLNSLRNGNRCCICQHEKTNEANTLNYEDVKKYIESFGYELISNKYVNSHEKLELRCPNNHIYKVNYNNFKSGKRCKYCSSSKGERKIMNWLESNNINYIHDKPYFKDLLSPLGFPLKPDFIIKDKKIWIEYDGIFHFEKIYEDDGHEKIVIHDEIKNKYAKENGWKLIRISYCDYGKIEEILELELK